MNGEQLKISDSFYTLSNMLIGNIELKFPDFSTSRLVMGIGGESGSGKTVTATCLRDTLKSHHINAQVLHMDGYFHLPPADNHQQRLTGMEHVGPHEVNLALLDEHITAFRGQGTVNVPLTDFHNNQFLYETVDFSSVSVLIVEGTYVLNLAELDYRVFIGRTYHQTFMDRMARGREGFDPFVEQVLEIEHSIIRKYADIADIIVNENFTINE